MTVKDFADEHGVQEIFVGKLKDLYEKKTFDTLSPEEWDEYKRKASKLTDHLMKLLIQP